MGVQDILAFISLWIIFNRHFSLNIWALAIVSMSREWPSSEFDKHAELLDDNLVSSFVLMRTLNQPFDDILVVSFNFERKGFVIQNICHESLQT